MLWRRYRLLALRGLLAQSRPLLAVASVVAVSSAVVALVPPVIGRAQADGLRHEVAIAASRERDIEVVQATRIPADRLSGMLSERLNELPPRLAATVGRSLLIADTPRYSVERVSGSPTPGGITRYLILRMHEGLDRHVSYAQGNPPAPTDETVLVPARSGGRVRVPLLEIALSLQTAETFGVRGGDVLALRLLPDQPQLSRVSIYEQAPVAVRVVDFFDVDHPDEQYWFDDLRAARPLVEDTDSARFVTAIGVVDRAMYGALLDAIDEAPLTFRWRYAVDPLRLRPRETAGLMEDLRALELRYGVVPEEGGARAEARTGFARVLDRFRAQQRAAVTTLSFAGGTFLGLALVVLGATALAGGDLQRRSLQLIRDRGARPADVVCAAAVAAGMIAAVAAAVGFTAVALGTGEADPLAALAALGVAVVAGVALAAALTPPRRPPVDPAAAIEAAERRSRRRAATEAVVVALAAASLVSLRTREVPEAVFDPLAVAAPLLVLAAVTLLTVRVLPAVSRRCVRLAARKPGLVSLVALRRAAQEPRAGTLLVAVGSVALGVGTFVALAGRGAGESGSRRSPLLVRVDELLAAASSLGVAYAAVATLLIALVVGRARAAEGSRLGELGLTRRQAIALGLLELVPATVTGMVVGVGAGALAFVAVEPMLAATQGGSAGAVTPALVAVVLLPLAAAAATLLGFRRRP